MFGWGEKKLALIAPAEGKAIDITAVDDPVFAGKMMGDGFAVEPSPESDKIIAPCDGEIALLSDTKHAVAIRRKGVEILIHVGLDTAALGGEGFTALVKAGDKVRAAEPLLVFDRAVLEARGKKLTTVLVLTNQRDTVKNVAKDLANPAAVLTLTLK